MKNLFKKILACCLVVCMVFTLCISAVTVSAEEATFDGTLTIGKAEVAAGATEATVSFNALAVKDGIAAAEVNVTLPTGATGISKVELDTTDENVEVTFFKDATGDKPVTLPDISGEEDVLVYEGNVNIIENVFSYIIWVNNKADVTNVAVNVKITFVGTFNKNASVTADIEACNNDVDLLNLQVVEGAINVTAAHTHNYVGTETKAATCTEPGVKTFTCTCGEGTYTEPIPVIPHTEEAIPPVDATCTTTGLTAGVKCSVCGTVLTDPTATEALGHNFGDNLEFCANNCGTANPDYVAPVTDSITVELYDANDYNYANVLISKGYEDLKTALEDACDYANGYIVENTFYNPVVILNEDVTLTSDVFVPEYTILDLGDNEIATNDYNVYMAGPYTEIRADYEVVMLKNNPFIGQKESAGVYHYTQKTTYSVSTANLTLGDQIFINFFATPESGSTTPSGATYHVAYYKETNADILYDVEAEGTASSFSIKTIGIPAKEMTDNYIARAYLEKVVDGVTYRVYTPEIKYSVLVYAKAQLSKDDPKWVALVKAMLNYGASAQLHFGHKTESLANAILDEADRELPADFEAEYSTKYLVKSKPVDDDLYTTLMTNGKLSTGYCNGEQNLTLLDGIEYNVFTTDCSSKNTYKLCIWSYDEYRAFVDAANGDLNALSEAMSIENCNNVVEVTDISKIKMPAIAVKNIADTMIYRLVEITPAGETYVDCIASGSPLTYANAVINSDKQSDSMKELCKRLAVYSACARAKFENQIK